MSKITKKKKPKRLVPKKSNHLNIVVMIILMIAVPSIIALNEKKNESEKVDNSGGVLQKNNTSVRNPNRTLINDSDYQECLNKKYEDDLISEELANEISDLNNYLKQYNISVKYVDKNTNFNYTYGDGKVYYAASSIKLLMATYIYDNIINGKIDPNDLIKYDSSYSFTPRKGLEKVKYGSMVTVRDLVNYSIKYSDNAAYKMLLNYIGGKKVLKEYGKSLGATHTLDKDDFGNITLDDALVYLKKLDEILYLGNEYSEELRLAFVNSDQNYFKTESTDAAAKYGEAGVAFNEIGIVYDTHNYYLVVLSNIGSKKAEGVFKEVSKKVQDIHTKFYSDRISYCTNLYNK